MTSWHEQELVGVGAGDCEAKFYGPSSLARGSDGGQEAGLRSSGFEFRAGQAPPGQGQAFSGLSPSSPLPFTVFSSQLACEDCRS